jgi:hypothetical protein
LLLLPCKDKEQHFNLLISVSCIKHEHVWLLLLLGSLMHHAEQVL